MPRKRPILRPGTIRPRERVTPVRRVWKIVLLAVLFTFTALLIVGLVPPDWVHPSDRDYYTQQ
jgi:hypothetical protein